ncbi:hypothetical protein SXCC_02540 [Gluconacetobacter sp. SXCC-1]|nr:hypothetical protein SXCC_02540 [Gluconacetobacter sp. SXCC-1]
MAEIHNFYMAPITANPPQQAEPVVVAIAGVPVNLVLSPEKTVACYFH